jgi:hypothetical protein
MCVETADTFRIRFFEDFPENFWGTAPRFRKCSSASKVPWVCVRNIAGSSKFDLIFPTWALTVAPLPPCPSGSVALASGEAPGKPREASNLFETVSYMCFEASVWVGGGQRGKGAHCMRFPKPHYPSPTHSPLVCDMLSPVGPRGSRDWATGPFGNTESGCSLSSYV